MAYYYVRNDGTATGDGGRYASQQTGDWDTTLGGTSNFYASVAAAIAATTSPVAGDIICVSDIHDHTYGASVSFSGVSSGDPFAVVCVDDTNIENARTSGNRGKESTSGGDDISFDGRFYASGIEFVSNDNMTVLQDSTFVDCKLVIQTASAIFGINNDNRCGTLIDTELAINDDTAYISMSGGGRIQFYGGSVTGTDVGGIVNMINGTGANGGCSGEFIGVDLTDVNGNILGNMGNSISTDDTIQFVFHKCALNAAATKVEEDFSHYAHCAIFTECSGTSATAEHQIYVHKFPGTVEDDTTIYRNDDEAFTDSATNISYKIVTGADATLFSPLWFDYPTPQYSELATASTDTLRFYVASTATLTDKDIYAEVIYPDGTNKHISNFATSAPTANANAIDVMASASALTTDSGSDWRDGAGALSGYNEYYFDVDTSGDVGADCMPQVRIYATIANTTIYLASEFDVVA